MISCRFSSSTTTPTGTGTTTPTPTGTAPPTPTGTADAVEAASPAVDGQEDGSDKEHENKVEEELVDQGHGDLDNGYVQQHTQCLRYVP